MTSFLRSLVPRDVTLRSSYLFLFVELLYGLYTLDTLTHGRVPNAHPNVSSEGEQERMAFFVCSLDFLYLSLILFTLLWK